MLELELEGGAGDLEDTPPAEGEGPAVGAANQSLQLRSQQEGEGHTGLLGFPHPAGEHAPEVITAGSQDNSVDWKEPQGREKSNVKFQCIE